MLWRSLLLLLSLQAISGTRLGGDTPRKAKADPSSSTTATTSKTTTTGTTTTGTTTTTAPVDKCAPNCKVIGNGEEVENPTNCNQFYVCFNEEPVGPIDCPDGQHFESSGCVAPAECTPSCGGGSSCHYECKNGATSRADRYDCSTYHLCNGDQEVEVRCNEDAPFFDGETCQTEEKKCCYCRPYCYKGTEGKQVFDPTDCTKFYYCFEPSSIPEYSGTCSSGNFDPFIGECSSTIPCATYCTNVVQSDGCIDKFTCEETGYHAKCVDKCGSEYYTCLTSDIGSVVESDSCAGIYVFDPAVSLCVDPALCSLG